MEDMSRAKGICLTRGHAGLMKRRLFMKMPWFSRMLWWAERLGFMERREHLAIAR